ncbi:winged helix-turn-helix transcriptional regulator [Halalkalicoccus jeotgali]|uniref:HxlR family transcriptional regulator n=1 Tax=Halalkalicoccus jeotgali (strain DSM 18796 / CECT 7217 / JCM 14584 / KCTC 4019 / B3) TaxID=795797 RepID=D8J877_HALJB|nr:winged helix-turn-helix transcriptional regulator [Halalkalicoccus jeotgali]ADJ14190.1 transcriptional regulator, HxlR family protein [Halalkalicoccus jeotgali B3]ELY34628.1 HxlR family transcriptional regulator [Halalkalicoccus jeotgali B3]
MGTDLWDVLGCKWTRRIVAHLAGGETRFNEIKRALGVPTSTLSARLKRLESSDIVFREVEESTPPAVHYGLTNRGERLAELLAEIDRLD